MNKFVLSLFKKENKVKVQKSEFLIKKEILVSDCEMGKLLRSRGKLLWNR